MKLFITSIDTNIGKTIVSSIVCKALDYSYWKPVQSGDLHNSDSNKIKNLSPSTFIHPETYRLTQPLSPHESANRDGIRITLKKFKLPQNEKLVIEGAGGVMVPLNEFGDMIIDLATIFECSLLLVVKNYLGSINHTLLTIKELNSRGFKNIGLILVGDRFESSERIIQKIGSSSIIANVPYEEKIDENWIIKQASAIRKPLLDFLVQK
ncbi:MAG: dethiobiotin synthase [Crocinitomicaceae bacterium]|nr:dethiobiotin synthase [Crocinitomicaceae bacterium]